MTNFRHELKYVCSDQQLKVLEARLSPLLVLDPHQQGRPFYEIRSMYFDDFHRSCLWENASGVDNRRKYRIRIYDHAPSPMHFEIKERRRGMTHKRYCPLTPQQYGQILDGRLAFTPNMPAPLKELYLAMETRLFRPVMLVQYQRTAYVSPLGNVRITFDRNICGCSCLDTFLSEQIPCTPVLPTGVHLLEVKYDEFLPSFLRDILDLKVLFQTSFSKYYLCCHPGILLESEKFPRRPRRSHC